MAACLDSKIKCFVLSFLFYMSFAKVIASIFSQLASGTPIYKISAPASIHQPKSGLEMNKDQIFSNGNCLLLLDEIADTSDPVERIAKLLGGLFHTHIDWIADKPFNPILGEFIEESCEVEGKVFTYQAEQICHHPPVTSFRMCGPSFKMEPVKGIDGSKGFKPGFNHVEINYAESGSIVTFADQKGNALLTFTPPGIKIDPIFSGKRTVGYYGAIEVIDLQSGIKFYGKLQKPFKLKGDIIDKEGNSINYVEGDFFTGVFVKSNQKLWIQPREALPLTIKVPKEVVEDPMYSRNIWGKVFAAMRILPPDFHLADKEKVTVEDQQRSIRKDGIIFTSRFQFVSPYDQMTENSTV